MREFVQCMKAKLQTSQTWSESSTQILVTVVFHSQWFQKTLKILTKSHLTWMLVSSGKMFLSVLWFLKILDAFLEFLPLIVTNKLFSTKNLCQSSMLTRRRVNSCLEHWKIPVHLVDTVSLRQSSSLLHHLAWNQKTKPATSSFRRLNFDDEHKYRD